MSYSEHPTVSFAGARFVNQLRVRLVLGRNGKLTLSKYPCILCRAGGGGGVLQASHISTLLSREIRRMT